MLLPFPAQVPFRSRMSWARAVVVMAPDRIRARNKGIIGFPLFHVCRINVPHGVAVALPFVVLGVAPVQVRRTAVVILIRRARRGGRDGQLKAIAGSGWEPVSRGLRGDLRSSKEFLMYPDIADRRKRVVA